MQNHKNLITLLVILFFVVSVGFLAYEINSNIQTQNEIRLALEQSQASKGGNGGGAPGGTAPILTSITPTSIPAGSPTQTLSLTGSNFASNAQVTWSGTSLTTSYISPTSLTAQITNTLLANQTTASISVTNPGKRGGTSNALSFTVTAPVVIQPPADTTPPTVSIASPANGATLSSTQTISASASDNVGVSKVVFQIDGSTLTTDTSAPYTANWDTTQNTNTTHTITATAYDAAGNSTNASVTVTVNNAAQPTPTGTVLFQDGFESGDFSKWSASGLWSYINPFIATSPSPVHSGTYSYGQRYQWTCCTVGDSNRFISVILPGQEEVYTRGWIYIKSPEADASPLASTIYQRKLIEWGDSTSGGGCCGSWTPILDSWNAWGANATTTNYLEFVTTPCGDVQVAHYGLAALPFDSWHELEVHMKLDTGNLPNGVVDVYLDGVSIYHSTNEILRGTCTTPLTGYFFGRQVDSPASTTIDEYRYWDDIAVGTAYIP